MDHIRHSFLIDTYPQEQYDKLLGLNPNNSIIHSIWRQIFINSTLEDNISWIKEKNLKNIIIERGGDFVDDKDLLINISNSIYDDYNCTYIVS